MYTLSNLITVVYFVMAVRLAVEAWKKRASLFDDILTADDVRLAQSMAFFFLWPPSVYLHELGHYMLAQHYHATDIRMHFLLYWGYVSFNPLPGRQEWWDALAGNLVTLSLGLIPLFFLKRLPAQSIWRMFGLGFANNQLFQVLIWYPLLCLGGIDGDFRTIYGPSFWWAGTDAVLVLHGSLLVTYLWAEYTDPGKRWVMERILGYQLVPAVQAAGEPEDDPLLAAHRAQSEKSKGKL